MKHTTIRTDLFRKFLRQSVSGRYTYVDYDSSGAFIESHDERTKRSRMISKMIKDGHVKVHYDWRRSRTSQFNSIQLTDAGREAVQAYLNEVKD